MNKLKKQQLKTMEEAIDSVVRLHDELTREIEFIFATSFGSTNMAREKLIEAKLWFRHGFEVEGEMVKKSVEDRKRRRLKNKE